MTMHSLESIAQNAILITFPVSDGDPSRRPDNMKDPPPSARDVNWHRTMKMDEKYFCRWRNLIGQGIAKLMKKPDPERHCIEHFPAGYWMFDHHKGPVSKIRHDLYLFGSKTVLRFRSPAEFIPHGFWLLTDPTLSTRNCGCKYCGGSGTKSQTEISENLGLPTNRGPTSVIGRTRRMRIGIPKPSGRPNISSQAGEPRPLPLDSPWVPPAERQPIAINPGWQTTSLGLKNAASNSRISDLTSSRRFRVGELVWGRRDLGHPPYWPAVVADFALDTISEWPTTHGDNYTVSHARRYSLLFLGVDDIDNIHVAFEEDAIFPWHGLHEYMESIIPDLDIKTDIKETFNVAILAANNLLSSWAIFNKFPIKINEPAMMQPLIIDAQGKVSLSGHSGMLSISAPLDRSTPSSNTLSFTETFPQHSPTRLVPPSPAKRFKHPSPMADIHQPIASTSDSKLRSSEFIGRSKGPLITQTRYEGIWYGAERIWLGDYVRLLPEREAFTESLRCTANASSGPFWRQPHSITPSPGAALRGVLMRLDRIFVKDNLSSSKQCMVAGPLYEVADEQWCRESMDNTSQPSESSAVDQILYPWELTSTPPSLDKRRNDRKETIHVESFLLPLAPPGYVLRPLLPSGMEVPLPVSFIAGRYYHDILKWGQLPQIPNPSPLLTLDTHTTVQADADALSSLCCLSPGRYNHATCIHMKLPNRTLMVMEAMDLARATLGMENGGAKSKGNTDDEMDIDASLNL